MKGFKPDAKTWAITCGIMAVIWTIGVIFRVVSAGEFTDTAVITAVTTVVWWVAFGVNLYRCKRNGHQ